MKFAMRSGGEFRKAGARVTPGAVSQRSIAGSDGARWLNQRHQLRAANAKAKVEGAPLRVCRARSPPVMSFARLSSVLSRSFCSQRVLCRFAYA